MKRIFLIGLFLISIFSINSYAQCREYIESLREAELEPYTCDANFTAVTISEGDSIQVNRTFNKGQSYKIKVSGMDLFMVEIKIIDNNKNVLFKNYGEDNPVKTNAKEGEEDDELASLGNRAWEFTPDQTVNLIITVRVPVLTKDKKNRVEGCLGVLVGFK